MKIQIADWRRAGNLFTENGLPYTHGQEMEGTPEDALRIAGECMTKGLNVMLVKIMEGPGTKKQPSVHTGWMVAVDTYRFQQR